MKPKKTASYSDQTADQRVILPIPWNNKRATTRSNDLNAIQWILHCEQCDIWNIRQCDSSSKALQSWATHNPFPKSVLRNCSSFLPMTFQEYELYQRKQNYFEVVFSIWSLFPSSKCNNFIQWAFWVTFIIRINLHFIVDTYLWLRSLHYSYINEISWTNRNWNRYYWTCYNFSFYSSEIQILRIFQDLNLWSKIL